jgi:hypothetical protein
MITQHRKPCGECPFARNVEPGTLGGSPAAVYVGQTEGPFFLACHCNPGYAENRGSLAQPQCAGAAIYRANLGLAERMPAMLLHLEPDPARVFTSHQEFLQHHKQWTAEEAAEYLRKYPPQELLQQEFRIAQERLQQHHPDVRVKLVPKATS